MYFLKLIDTCFYIFLLNRAGAKIRQWTRESLMRRLRKSLACDWMRPETVKHFPLRQFYVQLEWQQKIHHALRTEKVTLDSIHKVIEKMTIKAKGAERQKTTEQPSPTYNQDSTRRKYTYSDKSDQEASASSSAIKISSIIIEGKVYDPSNKQQWDGEMNINERAGCLLPKSAT